MARDRSAPRPWRLTARRRAGAVIFVLFVHPAWAFAQGAQFTVTTATASVHKGPTTASAVIGEARRGAVLDVTRNLGRWVQVTWPEAVEGVGYVHVSMGAQSGEPAPTGLGDAGLAPQRTAPDAPSGDEGPAASQGAAALPHTTYVAPPAHVVGLGALAGASPFGSGVSARAWLQNRIGLQFEASRATLDGPLPSGRMTATQYAPSVLFAFPDRVSDDLMVRPYLGAGLRVIRETLRVGPQDGGPIVESRKGLQAFGGGEITFAAAPRFTLSADLRYGWSRQAPAGDDLGGLGFALSGHWYVK